YPARRSFDLVAAPVIRLGAETAVIALVHAEPLDVLADQLFHELEIVAAIGGGPRRVWVPGGVEARREAGSWSCAARRRSSQSRVGFRASSSLMSSPAAAGPSSASMSEKTVLRRSSDGYCC